MNMPPLYGTYGDGPSRALWAQRPGRRGRMMGAIGLGAAASLLVCCALYSRLAAVGRGRQRRGELFGVDGNDAGQSSRLDGMEPGLAPGSIGSGKLNSKGFLVGDPGWEPGPDYYGTASYDNADVHPSIYTTYFHPYTGPKACPTCTSFTSTFEMSATPRCDNSPQCHHIRKILHLDEWWRGPEFGAALYQENHWIGAQVAHFIATNQKAVVLVPPCFFPRLARTELKSLNNAVYNSGMSLLLVGGLQGANFLSQNMGGVEGWGYVDGDGADPNIWSEQFTMNAVWSDGPFAMQDAAAQTLFQYGPPSLEGTSSTVGIRARDLPPGTKHYYMSADEVSVVFELPAGEGRIMFMGYDYADMAPHWIDTLLLAQRELEGDTEIQGLNNASYAEQVQAACTPKGCTHKAEVAVKKPSSFLDDAQAVIKQVRSANAAKEEKWAAARAEKEAEEAKIAEEKAKTEADEKAGQEEEAVTRSDGETGVGEGAEGGPEPGPEHGEKGGDFEHEGTGPAAENEGKGGDFEHSHEHEGIGPAAEHGEKGGDFEQPEGGAEYGASGGFEYGSGSGAFSGPSGGIDHVKSGGGLEGESCAEDVGCVAAVCKADSYCCENLWDSSCWNIVNEDAECKACGHEGAVAGATGGGFEYTRWGSGTGSGEGFEYSHETTHEYTHEGSGFETHTPEYVVAGGGTSGGERCAEDAGCHAAVCKADSFCCENAWDSSCWGFARENAECKACGLPEVQAKGAGGHTRLAQHNGRGRHVGGDWKGGSWASISAWLREKERHILPRGMGVRGEVQSLAAVAAKVDAAARARGVGVGVGVKHDGLAPAKSPAAAVVGAAAKGDAKKGAVDHDDEVEREIRKAMAALAKQRCPPGNNFHHCGPEVRRYGPGGEDVSVFKKAKGQHASKGQLASKGQHASSRGRWSTARIKHALRGLSLGDFDLFGKK